MKIKIPAMVDGKFRRLKVHAIPFVAQSGPLVGETFYLHWGFDNDGWSITEGTTGASAARGVTLAEVEADFYRRTADVDAAKWPAIIEQAARRVDKLRAQAEGVNYE